MSMMNSLWDGQDHNLPPTQDDDLQQFLDLNGMGNMDDSMQFDFQDFHNGNGADNHMLAHQHRPNLDTAMSGVDTPDMMSRSDSGGAFHQMPTMTSSMSFQSMPATMMPPPTPTEALVNTIDAQIQFLQQQKLQHQQQQLQEQQAALFAQQQRVVPPTPQSLEIQAGTDHFYPDHSRSDQTPQQQSLDYRYQQLKDHQDVSPRSSAPVWSAILISPLDAVHTTRVTCRDAA